MEKIDLIYTTSKKSCEIFVGVDLLNFLANDFKKNPLGNHLAIITDTNVERILGNRLQRYLIDSNLRTDMFAIRPGENSKQWETAKSIFEWMVDLGFDRKSTLLALGGGVVGDLTGFVASLYMRSIPYVQIPTTLLAQVDSSVGGKTAIDLGEKKNLLGTFHQPDRVYVDLSLLSTLSQAEIQNGLAEVIKSAVIRDRVSFEFLEDRYEAVLSGERDILERLVTRCLRIKSTIVTKDEKDRGLRQILNFGHTVGHAIESYTDYSVPHGRAVSMGISAETAVAARMGLLRVEEMKRILRLLDHFGLPTRIPKDYDRKNLVVLMHSDKKAEEGRISMVLPTAIGTVSTKRDIPPFLIESVLEEVTE
jgi:3-dehydroquinate synthase